MPDTTPVRTWLLGSWTDQARFAAMNDSFSRPRVYDALLGGCTALAAFVYGWPLLCLVAMAVVIVVVGAKAQSRSPHPEIPVAGTLFMLMVNLALSITVTGGANSPLLPLVLLPVFTQAVFFRPPVTVAWTVVAGVLVAGASMAAAVWLPVPAAVPGGLRVMVFTSLLVCLSPAARQLACSDIAARDSATLDSLTGLFNRRALDDHFVLVRGDAQHQHRLGVVLVDIDHFKAVNDTHGHDRGDDVLREVARRIGSAVRGVDLVHRYGGEEFLVLLPGADVVESILVAERVRAAVCATPITGLTMTVSAGACSAAAAGCNLVDLCRGADDALYFAKRNGRNQVQAASGVK